MRPRQASLLLQAESSAQQLPRVHFRQVLSFAEVGHDGTAVPPDPLVPVVPPFPVAPPDPIPAAPPLPTATVPGEVAPPAPPAPATAQLVAHWVSRQPWYEA